MTISLFSVPTTPQVQLYKYKQSWPIPTYPSSSSKLAVPPLCSPSPSASVIQDNPSPEPSVPDQSQYTSEQSACKACGREDMEKGCNGEGRIQGGIATIPGFGWWPIKAYRPCPAFVASGGRYRRQGQSMDEVAFGRSEGETPSASNKKEGPKKSKR